MQGHSQAFSHPVHVLAIDDNEDFLEVLSLFLMSRGVQVDLGFGGLTGLAKYLDAPESYDVILLDIQIPDMDGYEVARRIHENARNGGKKATIIGMSGHADAQDSSGFSFFLKKPFPFEAMLSAIADVVNRARADGGPDGSNLNGGASGV